MSSQMSSFTRSSNDHFLPDESLDPSAQRALRGKLEQIDYIAYVSDREAISQIVGGIDTGKFQRLAIAVARARANWVAAALAATATGVAPTPQQIQAVAQGRAAYEELAQAYEGLRRMVERNYLTYQTSPTTPAKD